MRVRTILGVLGTLTMAVALGLFIPTAALAHPPGAHEREVLAQPAVVFIETAAQADIVLHDGGLTRATYDVPVLASGSGALVNRSGTVVTAAPVVAPDLTRAKVYAVNRLFARQYGAPSGDPFMRHRLSDPRLDQKLQGCYRPERLTSDCAVFVRPRIRVFPFLATPGPALGAELLRAGRRPTDPAVLAVSGVNMPTVALAPTLKGATAVSTLGFAAPPRARGNPASIDQHLAPAGSTKLAAADLAALRKGLPNAAGAVVIGSGSGAAVGLIGAAPGQTPTIVPVDAVRQTLQSLGIQPARSAVDTDFASAHSFFAGNHYSHAVPRLQEVLRLYPGHALAARELQIALEKKGTAADRSLADDEHGTHGAAPSTATTGGSRTNLVLLYAGLGLLVLALLLAFVFGRRVTAGRLGWDGLTARGRSGLEGLQQLWARAGGRLGARQARRQGGEPAEPPAPPATPGAAMAASTPGRAPEAAPPAGSPAPRRVAGDRADLTVQRPRVVLPDGGVPAVPEQYPRAEARASTPPRPAPRPATPVTGVASTATRPQFCTQCGMKMAPEHRFCGFCGHDAGR